MFHYIMADEPTENVDMDEVNKTDAVEDSEVEEVESDDDDDDFDDDDDNDEDLDE